jgi:hypothetical protein
MSDVLINQRLQTNRNQQNRKNTYMLRLVLCLALLCALVASATAQLAKSPDVIKAMADNAARSRLEKKNALKYSCDKFCGDNFSQLSGLGWVGYCSDAIFYCLFVCLRTQHLSF